MLGRSTLSRFFESFRPLNARRRQATVRSSRPEALEERCLLAASTFSASDQFMLELMNRARANPSAEAARQGIALNQGISGSDTISTAAKQPLAPNNLLDNAANGHTADMFARNFFRHTSPEPWQY